MSVELQSQPAKARCYKCGSEEIHGICHHCGRAICDEHICRMPIRLGMWKALAIHFGFKKITDGEFAQYEPGFARLNLWEEILTAFGIAKIDNPEFRGYHYIPPLQDDASFFERLSYWTLDKNDTLLA